MRFRDILDNLNRPSAVVVLLLIVLLLNGFLLYRGASRGPDTSSAPAGPSGEAREGSTVLARAAPDPGRTASEEKTAEPETAGEPNVLQEAVRECRGDEQGCVRELIAREVPGAKYIGGRVDLGSGRRGPVDSILYFETPRLEPCEHEEQRYDGAGDARYTVFFVGEGSFDGESEEGCVPLP